MPLCFLFLGREALRRIAELNRSRNLIEFLESRNGTLAVILRFADYNILGMRKLIKAQPVNFPVLCGSD